MLAWDDSHMVHYARVAKDAHHATEHHLEAAVAGHPGAEQAAEIARLVAESDRLFREQVWPAIQRNDRARIAELHHMTERPVEDVVALNTKLNPTLEAESDAARREAGRIRDRAVVALPLMPGRRRR